MHFNARENSPPITPSFLFELRFEYRNGLVCANVRFLHGAQSVAKMYRVELYHKGDGDEVVEEMANIPCATTLVDAQRIMEGWLAARCPVLCQASHARLMDDDNEVFSCLVAAAPSS